MPHRKIDHFFTSDAPISTRSELAKMICRILHEEFGHLPSSLKIISNATGIDARAIKNWYKGKNMPSAYHLIILCRFSPKILRLVLEQIGGKNLFHAISLFANMQASSDAILASRKVPKNVLNERQRWFMILLGNGHKISAKEIAHRWGITRKTAGRDIKLLKSQGLVEFWGSKRNGGYRLCAPSSII